MKSSKVLSCQVNLYHRLPFIKNCTVLCCAIIELHTNLDALSDTYPGQRKPKKECMHKSPVFSMFPDSNLYPPCTHFCTVFCDAPVWKRLWKTIVKSCILVFLCLQSKAAKQQKSGFRKCCSSGVTTVEETSVNMMSMDQRGSWKKEGSRTWSRFVFVVLQNLPLFSRLFPTRTGFLLCLGIVCHQTFLFSTV